MKKMKDKHDPENHAVEVKSIKSRIPAEKANDRSNRPDEKAANVLEGIFKHRYARPKLL